MEHIREIDTSKNIKKLNIDIYSFEDEIDKEFVRISEELIKNKNSFISHVIESEYIKKDIKGFIIPVNVEVLKVFIKLTNNIRIENKININNPVDFYILQIMILENDLKYCYIQREKYKNFNNQNNISDIMHAELKTIKEKLAEKTSTVYNQEKDNKEFEINKKKVADKIISENNKLKSTINELIAYYVKGNEEEIKNLLSNLANNYEMNSNKDQIKSKNSDLFEEFSKNEEDLNIQNIQTIEEGEHKFIKKIVNEFDKVLEDQFKRIENYYKKDNFKRKSTFTKRKASNSEKNYIVYKPKGVHETWRESLRGGSIEIKRNNDIDISSMANTSRSKIKSSIKNFELSEFSVIRGEESKISLSDANITNFYGDKVKSTTPKKIRKDMHSRFEKEREIFENNVRAVLFRHKKK